MINHAAVECAPVNDVHGTGLLTVSSGYECILHKWPGSSKAEGNKDKGRNAKHRLKKFYTESTILADAEATECSRVFTATVRLRAKQ